MQLPKFWPVFFSPVILSNVLEQCIWQLSLNDVNSCEQNTCRWIKCILWFSCSWSFKLQTELISQFSYCTDYYLISVEYLLGYVLWFIVFCDKMKTTLFVTYLFFLNYIWCMPLLNCYLTIENVNKTDLSFSQVRYTSFLYSEKLVWWVMNDLQE